MLNRKFELPADLMPLLASVESAVQSDNFEQAMARLNECLKQFLATERNADDRLAYMNWLQAMTLKVRAGREHSARRAAGMMRARYSPWSRWVGLLFVLLPLFSGLPAFAGDQRSAMERQTAAAQRQREATEKRGTSDGFFQTRWLYGQEIAPVTVAPAADCPEVAESDLEAMISRSALGSVSPKLVKALIAQESGGKPCAVSSKGAMGLMQIMPALAAEMNVADPFDAEQNLRAGIKYLAQLSEKYRGNLSLMLAAYNAGAARVDAVGRVPDIAETQAYVKSILSRAGSID